MNTHDTHDRNDLHGDGGGDGAPSDAELLRRARLTAHALGETEGAEHAELEALVAGDPDAARVVAEVRAAAALLTAGLASESHAAPALPGASRAAVVAAAHAPAPAGRLRSFWPLVGMAASIVAGVALAAWQEAVRIPDGRVDVALVRDGRRETIASGRGEQSVATDAFPLGKVAVSSSRERGAASAAVPIGGRYQGPAGEAASGSGPVSSPGGSASQSVPSSGGGGVTSVPAESTSPGGLAAALGGPYVTAGGGGGGAGRSADGVGFVELSRSIGGGWRQNVGWNGAGPGGGDGSETSLVSSAWPTNGADPGVVLTVAGAEPVEIPALAFDLPSLRTRETQIGAALRVLHANTAEQSEATIAVLQKQLQEQLVQTRALLDSVQRGDELRDRLRLRYGAPGTESYQHPGESVFRDPRDEPLSTFSIDVDTASYANVRRFLTSGSLPPPDAVRVEELVNYFRYGDAEPEGPHPVGARVEVATCPWNTANRLVRVGVKAREIHEQAPPSNLVFLVDVSGSMQPADKLPLLQRGLRMLADQMREEDRVALVTYASNAGVRLDSTCGTEKETIAAAIDGLAAGGSTNGGAGIQQAYAIAAQHFVKGGVNRVILATDGDFNVGVTDRAELVKLIETQAQGGVFLTVLGVGTGNLQDATMEQLADRGNGNYHYLDGLREARKVLVDEMLGTVVTVAKDVKIQVEFNPATVGAYRLIGYENRMLAAADFNDDTKDAGEMGAGHTVTALYEVVPAGAAPQAGVDPLRYQKPPLEETDAARSGELFTLKVRYKLPDAAESTRFEISAKDAGTRYDAASTDMRFAAAVATFGMLLRNSPTTSQTSYDAVLELAQGALGKDEGGLRTEFLDLVLKAKKLSGR